MKEIFKGIGVLKQVVKKDGHRFAVVEGNRDCNRSCSYCAVPQQYRREQESTLNSTFRQIDWLHSQGFRLMSYLGGEPFAPFKTKEGITFAEHTEGVVKYATNKGMTVNVTTNGDFVDRDTIESLKKAGLDSITFSLHTYSEAGLRHLVEGARLASQAGIVPTIQLVFTSERASQLPGIAAHVAEQGILFSTGIVQEKGGGFSAVKKEKSLIPTADQQKEVLGALLRLKAFGLVRNNKNYLINAPEYNGNNWTCDPKRDTFIHIGAGGNMNVCSDVRTNIKVGEINDLSDKRWRDLKKVKVDSCGNCMYGCYYDSENPSLIGDFPTIVVMALIRTGNGKLAEKWGQFAVNMLKNHDTKTDWRLHLK